MTPRRRRSDRPAENETAIRTDGRESGLYAGRGPAGPELNREKTGDSIHTAPEDPMIRPRTDSRIPEEARRMSASPYGTPARPAVGSPAGNRAYAGSRLSVSHPTGSGRPAAARSPYQRPESGTREEAESRVRVGYAPGRMSEGREAWATPGKAAPGKAVPGRAYPGSRYPMPGRPASSQAEPPAPETREAAPRKRLILQVCTLLLILAGAFLTVVLALPKDNQLRVRVSALAEKAAGGIHTEADEGEHASEPATAPKAPEQFLSVDSMDELIPADTKAAENRMNGGAETLPDTTLPAENAGEKETAEVDSVPDAPGGEAGAAVIVAVSPAEDTEALRAEAADNRPADTGAEPDPDAGAEPESLPEAWDLQEEEPGFIAGTDDEADPDAEAETEEASAEETPEDPSENTGTDAPENGGESGEPAAEALAEPEGDPEPVALPVLTAEAVPAANPELIKTTEVFEGKKKIKEYSRAAKELIHMPSGWEYSKRQTGVLTFRGNAFRTNGAVGTVESAEELTEIWSADSGSARGSKQTYYGTGWTGQPAIVKWSKQIRESSNIYDTQKAEGMKEVIIAGLDGEIRFLDLDTGAVTRNTIKLGFPMRGTPSLHPSGAPYMSVGQYARNMKSGTGKIGLRQYNLYTQNAITLIDGTDKGANRAYNSTGSFETSALIDRTSDTAVVAGSNGLLYLISLNSDFDWQMGIYKSNQSVTVMRSKTKGQKNAMTAVESSPAMYDRYVFYADMGGILRCVDTNFLTPEWAVDTQDAVMAAIALDRFSAERLDLYTGNMLKNRKSGSAQIRRYDAMSGKEMWCTEIPVKKDKKNNTDSGCKASPVIGENSLSGLVFFTVTGLSEEGCTQLQLAGDTKAAVIALEKESGKIRWAYALSDRSDSSPIAVYDEGGTGWIIQCAWDGSIVALDGLTGRLASSCEVEGNIEASPAAYRDIMVIGTTGKGTEKIYGIRIGRTEDSNPDE